MAKHGGSCAIFQEFPLAGEPRDGSAFSFADGAVVCSTSLMASLIMKHETPAICRASRSLKQFSGLQEDYKFKFKYFIASYT